MLIPGGNINPGLSFFRAIQGLVQRPSPAGEAAQARATAQPTDRLGPQQRFATDVQQAARPADPGNEAARSSEFARGREATFEETAAERRAANATRPLPRGSIINLVV